MKIDTNYWPKGYNGIHEVQDWCKVRRLARAALAGVEVNPILVDGENLLAGTHRAAANDLLEMLGHDRLIDVVEFEDIEADEELIEAVMDLDYEAIDEIWDR